MVSRAVDPDVRLRTEIIMSIIMAVSGLTLVVFNRALAEYSVGQLNRAGFRPLGAGAVRFYRVVMYILGPMMLAAGATTLIRALRAVI